MFAEQGARVVAVPAALEAQITAANAASVPARVIVEVANGPTTPDADRILRAQGSLVVPDVLANAGGVTVSYFERVQDIASFFWSGREINQRLDRTAAYALAGGRLLATRAQRGLYP